jgi:hypothetical protein
MSTETKSCGDCAMCCLLLEVPAAHTSADVWCRHVIKSKGCAIYQDRPDACRAFRCLWLDTDALGDEWKPNRAKFLLRTEGTRLCIDMHPDHPENWRKERFYSVILHWAQAAWTNEGSVLVVARNQAIAIFPEEEFRVEGWEAGSDLLCGYAHKGGFKRPMYRLTRLDGSVHEAMGQQYPNGPR